MDNCFRTNRLTCYVVRSTKGSVLVTILIVDMPINKLSPRGMCTPTVDEYPVPSNNIQLLFVFFFL